MPDREPSDGARDAVRERDAVRARDAVTTELAHDDDLGAFGGPSPAVHGSSLFTFESFDQMRRAVSGEPGRFIYSRVRNPTVRAFEDKVTRLEGGEDGRAFASGMGAISAAVLSTVAAGDRVVSVRNVYPDAYKLFVDLLPRFGVRTDFVDGADEAAVAALLPGARLLYLESPTSLTFELQDVAALAALARRHGVVTVVDNSWATPLGANPLATGADLVVHSASKYLSGHSDVVAGVVVGDAERIARIGSIGLTILGSKLSAFEASQLLRGLRTLPLRMERHRRSALTVATFLEGHPLVARVHHPALPSHPQHEQFRRHFRAGSGLLSFELVDAVAVEPFVDALRLFRLGVSWGGYESLVYPAAIGLGGAPAANSLRAFGVPPSLVRLHVGLEDDGDLVDDLAQALRHAGARAEARTEASAEPKSETHAEADAQCRVGPPSPASNST